MREQSSGMPTSGKERRRIMVTGATGAIGAAIAERFDQAGEDLVLVDIESRRLEKLAECLGRNHEIVEADLGSESSISTLSEDYFEGINVLVNCAGVLNDEKLMNTSVARFREVMAVNVESMLLLSQRAIPAMVDGGWGRVINLGSLAWRTGGITAGTAYSISKAAVVGLTKSLAREYVGFGITVNAIAPAYIMSNMVSEQLADDERQFILERIPAGRFGEPDEVAHLVSYLSSPEAGFMTGEIIHMTGGLSLG